MSSNRAWIQNFKARCEDVGWRVELGKSGHHKTFDASGRLLFTFASTTGDRRSMLAVLSDAKRAGLLELESRVKLRRERGRLERIELDRKANGHTGRKREVETVTPKSIEFKSPASESLGGEPVSADAANLGEVNGVAIVAIAPAMVKSPVMSKPAPLAGAEELLLADQSIVYRCAKPAATPQAPDLEGDCHRVFVSAESLRAHIIYHSRKVLPVPPARRGRELLEEEGKRIAKKLREAADRQPAPAAPTPSVSQISAASASSHLVTEIQLQLTHIAARTDRLTEELLSIVRDVENVRDAVTKLPSLDPEVAEKAARFDALRGMLA